MALTQPAGPWTTSFLIAFANGALALLGAGLAWPERLRGLLAARVSQGAETSWLTMLMRLLTGLSLLGVAYAGISILLVPHCLQLR